MSDEASTAVNEVDGLLTRLQETHQALMDTIAGIKPKQFKRKDEEGDSAKDILQRSADDVNFYYGRLTARALSLPQPPDMARADFGTAAEAKESLQVAHRHLSRLLHDLRPEDLEKKTRLESTAEYTLRQVLETAVAHYELRASQIRKAAGDQRKGGSNDPGVRR